ncbi:MAG: inositol monophosphatase family protein [Candidatus Omnitrophica bacterium]|nr:inositol monophosphatase family protein [Candidatus Omnitrophota bacterium]MDD5488059.1 inositol monophosphatase family protein [Candidatus Omnitrophota bacterium]
MDGEYKNILETAVMAATEAGRMIFERVDTNKQISHKGAFNNLVTDVDRASEKMITDMIRQRHPEHSILAEEGGEVGADGSSFKWVIDPIDGTTNYAHGFPFFCVSIGVIYGKSVKVGAVYDPCRKELFTALDKGGAFLNGKKIGVSHISRMTDALMATGFAYDLSEKSSNVKYFDIMLKKAQAVRRAGSAALDLCYVACGRFDGYWEFNLSPWDTAAGQLIVREAGGLVSTLDGKDFDIYDKEILAANTGIYAEMREVLSSIRA